MRRRAFLLSWRPPEIELDIRQLTHGPSHHFFGYIGHVQNIPWNQSGRRIVGLETSFHDRMPSPDDAANVVLIENGRINAIERTRAWNFQQGTMFYWNPLQAESQVFFNDRDRRTNRVFTVLYDVNRRTRIREYRFDDTPIGNGGVAQKGGWFLGLNYGRMARLRPVTGYPQAFDWNPDTPAPADDGLFKVDVETGRKTLLVSFAALADAIPALRGKHLFLNHALSNRQGDLIYFYVRADFEDRGRRADIPCTVAPDGTNLQAHSIHIGGHPEWDANGLLIGSHQGRLVHYDPRARKVLNPIGPPSAFPDPGGDTAVSPDGTWIANSFRKGTANHYVLFHRATSRFVHSRGFDVRGWTGGELRIDGAPCWNRAGNQIAFTALSEPDRQTRQMFVASIR